MSRLTAGCIVIGTESTTVPECTGRATELKVGTTTTTESHDGDCLSENHKNESDVSEGGRQYWYNERMEKMKIV